LWSSGQAIALKQCSPGSPQAPPADECGSEFNEALVHEQVAVPANGEAFELVEMRDGLFDDPADAAESDDLLASALWDDRGDALVMQPFPESGCVVAAVGQNGVGPAAGPADTSRDRPDGLNQILGDFDIWGVSAGSEDREQDSGRNAGDVVLRAGTAAVDR
jgi:hypothetical protein